MVLTRLQGIELSQKEQLLSLHPLWLAGEYTLADGYELKKGSNVLFMGDT